MKHLLALGGALLVACLTIGFISFGSAQAQNEDGKRLITVFDRGETVSFISDAETLKDALAEQEVAIDPRDTVEPSLDEELVAPEYKVNIYRARPVIVVDGAVRSRVMSPYQTATQIAKHAGIELYAEDRTTLKPSTEFVGDGAGLVLTIDRATTFNLELYGAKNPARTHAATVGEMLTEKGIELGENDRVVPAAETKMVAGMEVRVWREGRQTITVDEVLSGPVEFVYDADRPLGYRATDADGAAGNQSVTYEIEVREGVEVSRKEIARITTKQPSTQKLIIGIKGLENGLTRSRGALHSTDSNGVVHRETYYDLDMRRVMRSCGQGGNYTVRFDGVKIDSEGYIIIAANYARYPKCSIVETSAGPGRVYDTGGFVSHHPDGFDLATDWSRPDGI